MGGGGGGSKKKSTPPPQAQPLDYNALMRSSSRAATEQVKQQYASLIENYPKLENLSFGTVDRLAGNLSGEAQDIYRDEPIYGPAPGKRGRRGEQVVVGTKRVKVGTTEGNQQTRDALDYIRRGLAIGELDPAAADPTSIERELYAQGERELRQGPTTIERTLLSDAQSELALGRSLSAEEMRNAQQSARAAFAARGLGSSLGSSAAEILNRDAMGRQREAERRAFAMQAEQYANAGRRERQGFASAANDQFVNNITQRRMNMANAYFTGAGNLIAADPYSRAVGPGLGLGMQTQGNQMQQIGNAFSNATQMAGNVASFNANMADSRYNAYMNNTAAMQAARMQAGASNNAATMGMVGSGVGMAVGIGAIAI